MAVTAGRFGSFGTEDPERPSRFQFSVLEQLEHIRKRIINSAIAIGVGVLVAFTVINPIVDFVFKPIRSVLPHGATGSLHGAASSRSASRGWAAPPKRDRGCGPFPWSSGYRYCACKTFNSSACSTAWKLRRKSSLLPA